MVRLEIRCNIQKAAGAYNSNCLTFHEQNPHIVIADHDSIVDMHAVYQALSSHATETGWKYKQGVGWVCPKCKG